VMLTDLEPSTTYYYQMDQSEIFSFVTAPDVGTGYPSVFAVVGDLGQTSNR
jgi:hypothetical protein